MFTTLLDKWWEECSVDERVKLEREDLAAYRGDR